MSFSGKFRAFSVCLFFGGLFSVLYAVPQNILHYKKVAGFYHGSGIEGCTNALNQLADEKGINVVHSENDADLLNLSQYDLVVYDNNVNGDGSTPTPASKQALIDYITGGGGYIGFHGAGDHQCNWDWYCNTLFSGNKFISHGGGTFTLQTDTELLANGPLSQMWEAGFLGDFLTVDTEKYRFDHPEMVRADPDAIVIQAMNPASQDYEDHVFTWYKKVGKGHMIYTGLGHQNTDFTQNNSWLKDAMFSYMELVTGDFGDPMGGTGTHPDQHAQGIGVNLKNINILIEDQGPHTVTISNLSGKTVAERSGIGPATYDISNITSAGIYSVKVNTPKSRRSDRIVLH